MFRTDAPDNVNGMYYGGDPITPTPATVISPDHLNAFQEEIISPIEAAGIPLDKNDNTQLLQALKVLFGRLATANTWAELQTFAKGITVQGGADFSGKVLAENDLQVDGAFTAGGSASFAKGPRITGTGEDYGFSTAKAHAIYTPATAFACTVSTGATGGPVMVINSGNGRPYWRAGDSTSAEIATVVRLPEGATITEIRWHIASMSGTQTQTVYPNGWLVSQSVATNTETQAQIHLSGSPGSTFTVAGSSGFAWYQMPLAPGPFIMPTSGYLHVALTLPPSINGAGAGLQVRGVRVGYTMTAVRPSV
ncbi:hypothetical protein F0U60_15020 [Archangium minus]|uniref:Tail fiber protein n=1 Tax=Archangium minus TaxID=83450 RepID=A0ABY9WQ55_9BACT|nr:hypothetical protein F0U60_15020 [Archangium minus]